METKNAHPAVCLCVFSSQGRFSSRSAGSSLTTSLSAVRKTPFLGSHLYIFTNDRLTKTGSGQA
jgi:hypothetical protein